MTQFINDAVTVLVVFVLAAMMFGIGRAAGRAEMNEDLEETAAEPPESTVPADLERALLLARIEELHGRLMFLEHASDSGHESTTEAAA